MARPLTERSNGGTAERFTAQQTQAPPPSLSPSPLDLILPLSLSLGVLQLAPVTSEIVKIHSIHWLRSGSAAACVLAHII